MLMIENSQIQRQTGAAVESFRNETVKVADRLRIGPKPINMLEDNNTK